MPPNEPTQNQQNPAPMQQPQQPIAPNNAGLPTSPMSPAPKKNSRGIVYALIALLVIVVFAVIIVRVVAPMFVNRPIAISDETISAQAQKDLEPLLQNDLQTFYQNKLSIQNPRIEGLSSVFSGLQKGGECSFTPQNIDKRRGGFDAGANKIYINGSVRCLGENDAGYSINLTYKGDSSSSEKYFISPYDNITIESSSQAFLNYLDTRQPPTTTHVTLTSSGERKPDRTFSSYKEYKTALNTNKLGTSCTETAGSTKVNITLGTRAGVSYSDDNPYSHFTNGVLSNDKSSAPDDYLVDISTDVTCQ